MPKLCAYPMAWAGFIKASNTGQQQRLPEATFSVEAKLVENSGGPGQI